MAKVRAKKARSKATPGSGSAKTPPLSVFSVPLDHGQKPDSIKAKERAPAAILAELAIGVQRQRLGDVRHLADELARLHELSGPLGGWPILRVLQLGIDRAVELGEWNVATLGALELEREAAEIIEPEARARRLRAAVEWLDAMPAERSADVGKGARRAIGDAFADALGPLMPIGREPTEGLKGVDLNRQSVERWIVFAQQLVFGANRSKLLARHLQARTDYTHAKGTAYQAWLIGIADAVAVALERANPTRVDLAIIGGLKAAGVPKKVAESLFKAHAEKLRRATLDS